MITLLQIGIVVTACASLIYGFIGEEYRHKEITSLLWGIFLGVMLVIYYIQ